MSDSVAAVVADRGHHGNRRPLLSIFLIVAVDVVGFAIMLPLLPFYVERTGASAFSVGVLISAYALCQLIASPVLGQISDRIGRRPVLLVSQAGTLAGFVVLALANTLPLLFLARIIDGLTAGNISVAYAYISDNTSPAERTKAFGTISAAFGVGMFLGPAISGVLAKRGLHAPIWAACCMSLLSLVATNVLLPEGVRSQRPAEKRNILPFRAIHQAFSRPETRAPLLLLSTFLFSFATFTSGLALFLAGRIAWHGRLLGASITGLLFAYAGLLNIFLQLVFLEKLLRKFEERSILLAGFLMMSAGYAGLAISHSLGSAICFLTLNNLGAGVQRPILTSQISKKTARQNQGSILGVSSSLLALSQILAPLLSGALIVRGYYSGWSLVASFFALLGFAGVFFFSYAQAGSEAENQARVCEAE